VKKYKWMNATLGISLETLADRMRRMKFDPREDDSEGFRIEVRRADRITGQFIERETLIEQISLPTGDEYEERRSRITITEFVVTSSAALNLMLVNPPRRSLPFFNALTEISRSEFSVEAVEVDVLRWIERLEADVGPAQVTFLDCNGIQLSPMVVGRFAFRGSDDVRAEVRKAIRNARPSVENARCELAVDGVRSHIELFKTGAAKLDATLSRELVSTVSKALSAVI